MDINDSFRARPSVGAQTAYYNPAHNVLHEGVVQSVSPSDRLDGTIVVYLPLSRTYVRANAQASYSSVNNIGVSIPLMPGDKVRVAHSGGNSSQATIVGYSSWKTLLPNHIKKEGNLLPLPENVFAGGLPGPTIPEWWKYGGTAYAVVYPVLKRSDQQFSVSKPGAYQMYTPVGDSYVFTPGALSTYSTSEVKSILSDSTELSDSIVSSTLSIDEVLEQVEKWTNMGGVRYTTSSITFDDPKPAVAGQADRTSLNSDYLSYFQEYRDEQFDAMEERLEQYAEQQDCIDETTEQVQDKSRTFFSSLLDELIQQGTSLALEKINQQLPQDLQLSVQVTKDSQGRNTVSRVGVGDLTYDSSSSTIRVNGSVFNVAADSAIGEVNKVLPPFLQVSSSSLGIAVGELVIKTNDLNNSEDQEFPIRDNVVLLNERGSVYLSLEGSRFSLGRLTDLVEDRVTSKGLSELNQVMPDALQVSLSKDNDGDRTLGVGPIVVKLEGENSGVSLDKVGLKASLDEIPEGLFQQLPAPAGALARILWQPLSNDIVNKAENIISPQQDKQSLSRKIDGCSGSADTAIPPTIIQVPTWGSQA